MQNQLIVAELEKSLKHELLNVGYPIAIDQIAGGFLSDFTYDWQPKGPQNKFLVTQARHVWTTSQAAMFFKENQYRKIAEHGFRCLRDKMWDTTYGGFYMLRNRQGEPIQSGYGDEKSAYGNAFAIYALAAYSAMSGDSSALKLAQQTFFWLEQHSHDPEYQGYFDRMKRDDSWYEDSDLKLNPSQLYGACWQVREANYYFDHVSFGHDVETAYLILEAAQVLGMKSDPKTLMIGKKLVDHALAKGWDNENGGFYERGYYFDQSDSISIISDKKIWWVQAEWLNSLLLMAKLFPNEKKYEQTFRKQWEYIKQYQIDHEHGGWYMEGLDKSPDKQLSPKGYDWKVNYHEARSLMNCIKMLRSEHELVK